MANSSRRDYALLLVLVLAFRVVTALPLQQAGYMDASYYMHVAENLAAGRGLVENVIWNYLDEPQGLPHPSNLYWMPLPSLLIAAPFAIWGPSYRAAQVPFVLLSLFLPLFAFFLSKKIFDRRGYAWAAAIFTAFSGFYTIYWVSPDNFTPFGLFAALGLYVTARGIEVRSYRRMFAAGALAGLAHLSRADGVLLLAVIPIVALLMNHPSRLRDALSFTGCALLGYLLVMAPWFLRDYAVAGSPYPNAGTKTLWLLEYDELFRFANDLTLQRYLDWGIGPILESKVSAAFLNLLILLFGDLQLFLAPFAAIGLWKLRRRIEMLPCLIYAGLLYAAMTLIFTFPSGHGSFLHSATALLPYLAVAVPPGIDSAVQWIARRRRTWDPSQATRVFQVGFCMMAVGISTIMYSQGVFGSSSSQAGKSALWNDRAVEYEQITEWLDRNAKSDDKVMVVDPPTFYNSSHRPSIVIPTDDVEAIFAAAQRYKVKYLVLQFDHPKPMNDLYHGRVQIEGLRPVAEFVDASRRPVTLFEIGQSEASQSSSSQ